jgi:hypothetical protein
MILIQPFPQLPDDAPDDAGAELRERCFEQARGRGFPKTSLPHRRSECVCAGEHNWQLFIWRSCVADVAAVVKALAGSEGGES